jgi:uncharacterized Rossmann fold enzyme
MDWLSWSPLYQRIVLTLGLDKNQDIEVGEKYYTLLKKFNPSGFKTVLERILTLNPKRVFVFGAGPSVEQDFLKFQGLYDKNSDLIVAADGSSLFLIQNEIYPKIVFTDLDGSIQALKLLGITKKSFLIIHAHGDNFNLIKKHISELLLANIVPTVQTLPTPPITYNFGGFTDGDRAVSAILEWFPSLESIYLLGFTFGEIQGRYSKPEPLKSHVKASKTKLTKLNIAKEILEFLATKTKTQIINLSQPTDFIKGIQNISN